MHDEACHATTPRCTRLSFCEVRGVSRPKGKREVPQCDGGEMAERVGRALLEKGCGGRCEVSLSRDRSWSVRVDTPRRRRSEAPTADESRESDIAEAEAPGLGSSEHRGQYREGASRDCRRVQISSTRTSHQPVDGVATWSPPVDIPTSRFPDRRCYRFGGTRRRETDNIARLEAGRRAGDGQRWWWRARPTASSSDHTSWNWPVPARAGMRPRSGGPVRRRPAIGLGRRAALGEQGEQRVQGEVNDARPVMTTSATATSTAYRRRVPRSPIRTARVRLPAAVGGDVAQVVGDEDRRGEGPDADRPATRPGAAADIVASCRAWRRARRRRRRRPRRGRGSHRVAGRPCRTRPQTRRRRSAIITHRPQSATSASPTSAGEEEAANAAILTAGRGEALADEPDRADPHPSVPRTPSE